MWWFCLATLAFFEVSFRRFAMVEFSAFLQNNSDWTDDLNFALQHQRMVDSHFWSCCFGNYVHALLESCCMLGHNFTHKCMPTILQIWEAAIRQWTGTACCQHRLWNALLKGITHRFWKKNRIFFLQIAVHRVQQHARKIFFPFRKWFYKNTVKPR